MAVNPENFFNGDGSTTLFPFTFEYLEESDVKVSVDGTVKTQDTDYTFANATTISFNTAPASGSDNVRIYRDTNVDELKSTFFAGSAIRASDLNDNLTQNNYAVQEIKAYTWDNETDTIHSNETWVSSDTQIATTAAMDQRFQDEAAETITSAETWPDNDDTIATTAAIDNRIDTAITNDIGTDGTGITVTDDGDGTITLGLADNAIDFSKIKDADIITDTEQDAGSPSPTNDNLFSALGAARRFDTIVNQAEQSTSVNWEVGKTWLQNDSEKTVRIWDGSAWVAVASGGAFTTLPKVVYVDSVNGDDSLEGHRISNPKRTIKAAIQQINAETDEVGDGSVVIVAPGVYQEIAPIDIQKKNVSIIGQALRSCIVHPTPATETNTLFRLNSGSYVANLTLTGVKASGTRGGNSLDTDPTYGLPTNQGWNFAFYPGATIVKSPYIANCTNFSDSEIDNSDLNAFNPRGGLGGDTDSAPTGGGILVDGAVVSSSSPLRSMVCDSYTHVGLDGPGIFVTNNGYCQATSSYAFFTHYHIKTLNGGQANLAASTSDFGRYALIAQGRSSSAIFTATTTATASSGATTFTIGAPSASGSWFGSATRPQANMVVDIGGNTYSIIGATANGSGWDVEISRPDPNNLSTNLGLNGAVSSGSAVSFYLRSMIASSGHTMEYVGSGTNYSALPENGGVPVEANEIVEIGSGKVWAATTNHQGKFTVGPTFNVDQVTGYVNIANGAIGIEKLIENLDLNSFTLSDSTGDVNIDDQMDMNTHKIVNVVDPASAQDAATKNYVDTSSANTNYVAVSGDSMTGDLNMNGNNITGAAGLTMTGDITMNAQSDVRFADADSSNYVAIQAPATIGTNYTLTLPNSTGNAGEALITDANGNLSWSSNVTTTVDQIIEGDTKVEAVDTGANGEIQFTTDGTRAMTIDSSQRVGVGTASPQGDLSFGASAAIINLDTSDGSDNKRLVLNGGGGGFSSGRGGYIVLSGNEATNPGNVQITMGNVSGTGIVFKKGDGSEAGRWDSSGRLGVGTSSPSHSLHVNSGTTNSVANFESTDAGAAINITDSVGSSSIETNSAQLKIGVDPSNSVSGSDLRLQVDGSTKLLINDSGNVGIGTSSPRAHVDFGAGSGSGVLNQTVGNYQAVFESPQGTGNIARNIAFAVGTNGIGAAINAVDNGGGDATGLIVATGTAGSITERLRITSSGNVGIGTSSPGYRLDIQAADTTASLGYAMRLRENSTAGAATIQFTDSAVTVQRATITVDSSSNIRFGNSSERLRIDSSGNVGIGTTSPSNLLTVSTNTNGTTSLLKLHADADGIDNGVAGIKLSGNSGDHAAYIYGGHLTSGNSFLSFYTDLWGGSHNPQERVRIDSSGNVGIGTSSPGSFNQVVNAPHLVVGNGATSAPGVTIYSTAAGTGILAFADGTAGNQQYRGYVQYDQNADQLNFGSNGPITFSTGTERARIDSSGRLLVGTTSATGPALLDITGYSGNSAGQGILSLRRGSGALFDGNVLGEISFGDTIANTRASILAVADGTGGTGDLPTRLSFWTTPDGSATLTEVMRIANDGELNQFGTNANFRSSRTGSAASAFAVRTGASDLSSGTVVFRIWGDGDASLAGTLTQSDAKLKENIVDANSQWADIKGIRIRNWNYKEETGFNTDTQIGVVAQELEIVSPELVKEKLDFDENDNPLDTVTKFVNTSNLLMKSVKALQEAMERIEQLEANNAALEARVAALEAN